MSEAMMRIAGRAGDGTARAISVVVDGNGEHVLRTVDAAPHAYDETTDTITVRPKRSLPAVSALSTDADVAAGASYTWTLTPPAGEVWRIRSIGLNIAAPVGATSGTHLLDIYHTAATTALNQALSINNVFGAGIKILGNTPMVKAGSIPSSEEAFRGAIVGLACSNSSPLVLVYTNLTNAAQTGILGLSVVKEIEHVA